MILFCRNVSITFILELGFKLAFAVQVVREHYLRDDIYCGAPFCKVCDVAGSRLSSDASTIIVVDTNVVLHQVEILFSFWKVVRNFILALPTEFVLVRLFWSFLLC